MSIVKCLNEAVRQGHIDQSEADQIAARYAEIRKMVVSDSQAKADLAKDLQAEADARKRVAVIQHDLIQRNIATVKDYRNHFGEVDLVEGFKRLHENFGRDGGAFVQDAANLQRAIAEASIAELADLMKAFKRGVITGDMRRTANKSVSAKMRNVVAELFGQSTGDAEAKAMADAWTQVAEKLRVRFNEAGGTIGKLERWGLPQGHNKDALIAFKQEAWVAHILPLLDRDRMVNQLTGRRMSDDELKASLRIVWERITTDGWVDKEPSGQPQGRGALWKQRADHRYLHFKDADAWLAYAKDFGNPDPFAAMMGHISGMARDIAHMETFGPNPHMGREYLKQWLTQQQRLIAPTASRIAEHQAMLNDLAGRLKSPNPEFEKLTAELATLAQQMTAERDTARAQTSKAMRAERAEAERRKKHLQDIGGDYRLSEMTIKELNNIIADPALKDMTVIEARLHGMRRSISDYGLPFRAIEYALGGETNFREYGSLGMGRMLNRMTPQEAKARLAEIITANDDLAVAASNLNRIDTAISRGLGKEAAAARERAIALEKRYREVTDQLIPYWNDPALKTIEDQAVAERMREIAEDMSDPIAFAQAKDPEGYLTSTIARTDAMWEIMRGSVMPANTRVAKVFTSIRNMISASSLGAAWYSSLSDPSFGQDMRLRFGLGMSQANFGRVLAMVMKDMIMMGSRDQAVRARLGLDSALNILHREAGQSPYWSHTFWTGFAADRVLTWNLLAPWTQAGKHLAGMDLMGFLADQSGLAFAALDKRTRKALTAHGFDAASWDAIRAAPLHEPKRGATWLRANEIEQHAGRALAERYQIMIQRETRYAVPEATVESRSVVGAGRPGAPTGELWRSMMQFKGFGLAVVMLHANRVARDIMMRDRSIYGPLTAFVITSAFLGAVAMSLKDVKDGRDPRKWLDERTYLDPAFWGAAFLQAGGLGIYGDFMFSNTGRHNQSLSQTVAGPLIGRLDNILALTTGNLAQHLRGEKTNAGREAVRFARQNIPGSNIVVGPVPIGLILQRKVFDQLQHMVDPEAYASFSRQMQTRAKDYRQEFWWRPGEAGPSRAPNFARVLATR